MDEIFSPESIRQFAKETPFFVFSKARLVERYKEFTKLFPNALVQYAMKANSEREVLQILAEAGSGFEVASIYELHLLKELGVPADRLVYGTSVKPTAHIKEFSDYGVNRFAFDSFSELEKIALSAPTSKVYARVTVDDTGSIFKLSGKFGAEIHDAVPLLLRARELGLVPYGLSFHVGSQALNPNAWAEALRSIKPVFEELSENNITLEILNIGGGQPHIYPSNEEAATLEVIAKITLEAFGELPYQPMLMIEPGRAMVANSAVLVTTIIAKVTRGENTWLFLDAGAYNALFETMAYQGSIRYSATSLRHSYDAGEGLFILTGPTGDSIDIITKEARLPLDIDVGDKIVIHDVGAYSLSLSSAFNGFPKPAIYIV